MSLCDYELPLKDIASLPVAHAREKLGKNFNRNLSKQISSLDDFVTEKAAKKIKVPSATWAWYYFDIKVCFGSHQVNNFLN